MERKRMIDVTNKKLRLLVTKDCPNHCPLCCNNRFDFEKLPVVDRWDYEEIMITGGEPMLFPAHLYELVRHIRGIQKLMGMPRSKIYVYTADILIIDSAAIMGVIDGIVYTPHSRKDVQKFIYMDTHIREFSGRDLEHKSLRINLFPDVKSMFPMNFNRSIYWDVKNIEWIKDCPVPKGEDFRRIDKLWEL